MRIANYCLAEELSTLLTSTEALLKLVMNGFKPQSKLWTQNLKPNRSKLRG